MTSPRDTARRLAAGQEEGVLAVPLALHVSARIQERDPEDFLYDPTQLANALRDLIDAIHPDGVLASAAQVLLADCKDVPSLLGSVQLATATEATRRLRASFGDRIVVVCGLPGPAAVAAATGASAPAAADASLALAKEFLAAGCDVLLIEDDTELAGASLSTLANVARFHQALAVSHPQPRYGLPGVVYAPLDAPVAQRGLVTTPEHLPRQTDVAVLRDWVSEIRGG